MLMQRRLMPGMAALLAFDALARSGSFTAAARELNLTQGAVSRQIAALEGQLGASLIDRSARPVQLTPAGETYARRVRAALEQLGQGALELIGQGDKGGLTLAMVPTFGTRWLMPRIPGFVRRHPEVTLHFVTRIGRIDLRAEGIDAAIHSGRADWPGTRATLLMTERLVPVAAPPVAARGLDSAPLLALVSRPRAWADWRQASGLAGPTPAPAMRFEQFATLAQAAAAGLGAALMPAFLIQPELDNGTLVTVGPEHDSGAGYWFIEPDTPTRKPAVQRLRDWLLTEIARDTVV